MKAFYDQRLKRQELLVLTNAKVLENLKNMFPEKRLYSISLDWRKDDQYFLKARGTLGDAIIGWSDRNV